MAVKFEITDGFGSGNKLKVNKEGALNTVVATHPPIEEQFVATPFRQYLTTDGTSCGTFDMQTTVTCGNVEYYIKADSESDIYIKSISVIISDVNATLDKFGAICALSNGVQVTWDNVDLGSVTIADALKSNFDFVRLSGGTPAFGGTSNSFIAGNVSGNSEGVLPFIDFTKIFGLPWGIKLRAGSTDRLVFTIRDNTTGVDAFNAIGYGSKILQRIIR